MASKSKTGVKFPSIQSVASEIIDIKAQMDKGDEWDVRLQVTEGGSWCVRTGDPQYDLDHNGYWGSGYLTRTSNCRDLAYEMLEEAKDQEAMERSCNA